MAAGDRRYILHFDWTLFILVLALAGIGLVSVISASYGGKKIIDPLVIRQLIWIAAGTAALLNRGAGGLSSAASLRLPVLRDGGRTADRRDGRRPRHRWIAPMDQPRLFSSRAVRSWRNSPSCS